MQLNKLPRFFSIWTVGIWIALSAPSGWAQIPQDTPAAAQGQSTAQEQQPVSIAAVGTALPTEDTPVATTEPTAQEQQPVVESNAAALDKARRAAQNPIASMISVPFQENWNFGIGPADRVQNIFNIQPVVPVGLGANWNVIMRFVTPIIYQPYAVPLLQPSGSTVPFQTGVYGLGDMQPQFYFSPKHTGPIIWGAGPIFLVPTASYHLLSQGKFGIGPTFVALAQPHFGTIGVLVNNIWSVAGHENKPDVNQFYLQPFLNYNLKKAWYLSLQSSGITANWEQTHNRWVVPIGGGPGRVWKFGHQTVNVQSFFFANVVHPPGASPWAFRMAFTLLFPKPR